MVRRLEADGLDTLLLEPEFGFRVSVLDIGLAEIRSNTYGRVDADGDDDTTRHHGAAAVSMQLLIKPTSDTTAQALLDRLRGFCRPALRPYLYFDDEDGVERRIRLRPDQASTPWRMPGLREVQIGWRAPDGIVEAAEPTVVEANATVGTEGGIEFPITFPLVFSSSSPVGAFDISNDGTAVVYPMIELWGPSTGPRIENRDGDGYMSFPSLTLDDSEWLEIDTRDRTILLNGLSNQLRYDDVDFETLVWPAAAPGTSSWRYFPESFGDGARAVVSIRSGWQ